MQTIQYIQIILIKILHNAESIQAISISIGTVFAGAWTYLLFVRQRLHYPKVKTSIVINKIDLENQKLLIRVDILLENIGNILLKSNYAELRLRKIEPICPEVMEIVKNGCDPVDKNRTQIEWPCIVQRKWNNSFKFEIEPGETDSIHADFFIDNNLTTIEFYFFMQNKRKKKGIGWTLTTIYSLSKESSMAFSRDRSDFDHLQDQQPLEQKQQQQQPSQTPEQKPPEQHQSETNR